MSEVGHRFVSYSGSRLVRINIQYCLLGTLTFKSLTENYTSCMSSCPQLKFPVLYRNPLCPCCIESGKNEFECVVALICSNEVFVKNIVYFTLHSKLEGITQELS